jgi:hypothetical protein
MIIITAALYNPLKAQTIVIDSTFTVDGEIFPFGQGDTIYGLSISGSVELFSDTSLVRVILSDQDGNEWMVYEAYSLILPCGFIEFSDAADETKFLQVNSPLSIEVQIIEAELNLEFLLLLYEFWENLESLQETYKETIETRKVDSINYTIEIGEMLWFADKTPVSDKSYSNKKSLFGDKYNLRGLDYYTGGVFDPIPGVIGPADDSPLIDNWDWRNRHGANDPDKADFYYDDDPIGTGWLGWLTPLEDQGEIPSCTGLCYIYSPLAVIEGFANLYLNDHIDYNLSEQNILDCDPQTIDDCNGGQGGETFYEVQFDGVVDEECYPRDNQVNNCRVEILPPECPNY